LGLLLAVAACGDSSGPVVPKGPLALERIGGGCAGFVQGTNSWEANCNYRVLDSAGTRFPGALVIYRVDPGVKATTRKTAAADAAVLLDWYIPDVSDFIGDTVKQYACATIGADCEPARIEGLLTFKNP